MARYIFAIEAFAPTPSLPKRGDVRKVELIKVGDRGTLGSQGPRQTGSGSTPWGQDTTPSAVLFLKCS